MKQWMLEELVYGFKTADRNALARAITLVESTRPEHRQLALQLLKVLPAKPAKRIGISGTPGVGKSSFIEVFGLHLIQKKMNMAVLAVDPTSQVSGGSILGDKTRMEELSRRPEVFIRPSPSGGTLGGVARRTKETIELCEAFGFDLIVVETVGVGQSETTVAQLVDCFLMLLQPGAGDDLQGIKRGILELVDMVIVTKADGKNVALAEAARHHYQQALHILRTGPWSPPVLTCSSLEKRGLEEIWNELQKYFTAMAPELEQKRAQQRLYWLDQNLKEAIEKWFMQHLPAGEFAQVKLRVAKGELTVGEAIEQLLKIFNKK